MCGKGTLGEGLGRVEGRLGIEEEGSREERALGERYRGFIDEKVVCGTVVEGLVVHRKV